MPETNATNAGDATPESLGLPRLERRADSQVWAVLPPGDATSDAPLEVGVRIIRPFPWSAPDRYVSLRDADDNEVALIENPDTLDDPSRRVLYSALAEVSFVMEIESVQKIDTEFEIRNWKVTTRQGARTFQTKRDDWPMPLEGDGLLIRDIEGDLFRVPNREEMDAKSQRELWAFVD